MQLYKCVQFPDVWEKDKILIKNIKLVDTVFLKKNNDVYGFSCRWNSLNDHHLAIFKMENENIVFSESLVDTIDSSLSRPAGKIIYDEFSGREIMVSQICKPKYGSGLVFKEFDLEFPHYKEKELYRIFPSSINSDKVKKWDGIHTFNVSENYTVIDLIWSRFNFVEKSFRFINKLKKLLVKR